MKEVAMNHTDADTPRRVLLGACVLTILGLGVSGVVMANRPESLAKADACGALDPALLAQVAPTLGAHDEPVGAAADRAMTMVMAARRLCESGDAKAAQTLYRRASNTLTRFGSGTELEAAR
jgi:hypothetical protein